MRYTDPTGLSTLVCCDPDCTYLCAADDASNSNPGGTEGSPQYPIDNPEDPELDHKYKSRQEECQDCDCKDRADIKTLKKLKNKVIAGEIGIALAYGFLCAAVGGMLCIGGGPVAAGCAAIGGLICGTGFGLLTRASLEDIINDIHWSMKELKCSCAIYC